MYLNFECAINFGSTKKELKDKRNILDGINILSDLTLIRRGIRVRYCVLIEVLVCAWYDGFDVSPPTAASAVDPISVRRTRIKIQRSFDRQRKVIFSAILPLRTSKLSMVYNQIPDFNDTLASALLPYFQRKTPRHRVST